MIAQHRLQQQVKVLDKEVEILEIAQYQEVEHNVGGTHHALPSPLALKALDEQAADIAAGRGERYQSQEAPIPPAVEDVTRQDDQQILPAPLTKDEPVEQEHYREKYQELE